MDFLKAELQRRKKEVEEVKITASVGGSSSNTNIITSRDGRKIFVKNDNTSSNIIPSIPITTNPSTTTSVSSHTNAVSSSTASHPNNQIHTSTVVPSSTTSSTSTSSSSSSSAGTTDYSSLSLNDIISRLRKYNLVITYFGESSNERLQRLINYEIIQNNSITQTITSITSSSSNNNNTDKTLPLPSHKRKREDDPEEHDEQQQSLLSSLTTLPSSDLIDKVTKAKLLSASLSSSLHIPESSSSSTSLSLPSSLSTQPLDEKSEKHRHHTDAIKYQHKDSYKYMYNFWRGLLYEWEQIINQTRTELESTALGKQEIILYNQAEEYMRPFFKACKHENLPHEINKLILEITDALLLKDYIKAGDSYMKLAIGNQQWLMGVSQVGLHERSAREKVYVGKITHVLNDESQRKYITTIKRLITFFEKQYPTDPSKMV